MECFEDDIDVLAGLLDDEEFQESAVLPTPGNASQSQTAAMTDAPASSDLENQLKEMERTMEQLRRQLQEQKRGANVTKVDIFSQRKEDEPKTSNAAPISRKDFFPDSSDEDDEEGGRSAISRSGKWIEKRLAHSNDTPIVDRLKTKQVPTGWKTKESSALVNLSKPVAARQSQTSTDSSLTNSGTGINIINPRVSSSTLQALTENRRVIRLSQIKLCMRNGDIEGDWVTMAVLVAKTEPRTSQSGKTYSIWKLSDLKDCSKTYSLFLFGEVHKTHWKMSIGSVVGLLNCGFFKERQGSQDEVTMTIDHPQKILHVGSSKDLSWCRGTRKDGVRCTAFVNKAECEFCIYHVQSEFKKTSSKRAELQSSFSGTGVAHGQKGSLQQRVLGKQEVFYGGKIFTGKVAPGLNPSAKGKDKKILESLKLQKHADLLKTEEEEASRKSKSAFQDLLQAPSAGARNFLQALKCPAMVAASSAPSKPAPVASISAKDLLKQHQQQMNVLLQKPTLGKGFTSSQEINLDLRPAVKKPLASMSLAKLKAIQMVKTQGPLNAADPNKPLVNIKDAPAKRKADAVENQPRAKRSRDELDALINAGSSHAELLDTHDLEQQELYFNKLEKKEVLENKMLSTFEVKTTAVVCPVCKYTALSASDLCRSKGHPLRTVKAMKRFFKCKDCKNRTTSLDRLPKRPCSNCGGTNWEKAAMGKERKGPELPHEKLSLRGDEIRFVGDLRASAISLDS